MEGRGGSTIDNVGDIGVGVVEGVVSKGMRPLGHVRVEGGDGSRRCRGNGQLGGFEESLMKDVDGLLECKANEPGEDVVRNGRRRNLN